jgi:hypothetical protein
MENEPTPEQLKQLNHHRNVSTLIDDSSIQDFGSFQCHDAFNNYTFAVARKKGTTFINPSVQDQSLIELKVGVLLPFHQSNNEWTRVMTMRYMHVLKINSYCSNYDLNLVVFLQFDWQLQKSTRKT